MSFIGNFNTFCLELRSGSYSNHAQLESKIPIANHTLFALCKMEVNPQI